jgi:hypothetical protein
MSKLYPALWNPFCEANGLPSPCGLTSLYPIFSGATGQPGSDGVTSFTTSSFNNGAITYVEYGYAVEAGYPVVSLLNKAGYYVQPTPLNAAIALQGARLNADRTQVLDGVYAHPDPRAYPLSSYSYMIVPTSTNAPFSAEKGRVLGEFINYFLCEGQQKAQPLGYAPLPPNLVQTAFEVVRKIPGAPAPPALASCNNPTITGGFSPEKAPLPPPSARVGATPAGGTTGGTDGSSGSATTATTVPCVPVTTSTTSTTSTTVDDATTSTTDADGAASTTTSTTSTTVPCEPGTGAATDGAGGDPLDAAGGEVAAIATPLEPLPATGPGVISVVVVVLLLAMLLLPPLFIGRSGRTGAKDVERAFSQP